MRECLIVGVGGMLGSIGRYLAGSYFLHAFPNSKIPYGTLFVNLLGCFFIGLIAKQLERVDFYNTELRLLLITGVLGGFTTFSAFSIESLQLFREGAVSYALFYSLFSVMAGIIFSYLGFRLS